MARSHGKMTGSRIVASREQPIVRLQGESMAKLFTRNYLVAFIDLLGQRAQMEGLLFLPPKGDVSARLEFQFRILRSMSAVDYVQQNVSRFAKVANRHQFEPIKGVPKAIVKKVQKYRATKLYYQQFSDGIVVYSPLSAVGHYPLGSVFSLMGACASIMLLTLDKGFPIRVGIAVGAGCRLHGKGIYGPVVAEAYRLESEVANYVRIVVHPAVLGWLESFGERQFDRHEDERVACALAQNCKNMLMIDADGVLTLDFLNKASLDMFGGAERAAEPIAGMKKFVSEMLGAFDNGKNERVLQKYQWLSRYIESRLPS
jgi:hypothetical protein